MQGLNPGVQGRFVPGEELGSDLLHPHPDWGWFKCCNTASVPSWPCRAAHSSCHWQCDGEPQKQFPGIQSFPDLWLRERVGSCSDETLFTSGSCPVCRGGGAESCSSWDCGSTLAPKFQHYLRMESLGQLGCAQGHPKAALVPQTRIANGAISPKALCWVSPPVSLPVLPFPDKTAGLPGNSWKWQAAAWVD